MYKIIVAYGKWRILMVAAAMIASEKRKLITLSYFIGST
jgi:hypothetical protein